MVCTFFFLITGVLYKGRIEYILPHLLRVDEDGVCVEERKSKYVIEQQCLVFVSPICLYVLPSE